MEQNIVRDNIRLQGMVGSVVEKIGNLYSKIPYPGTQKNVKLYNEYIDRLKEFKKGCIQYDNDIWTYIHKFPKLSDTGVIDILFGERNTYKPSFSDYYIIFQKLRGVEEPSVSIVSASEQKIIPLHQDEKNNEDIFRKIEATYLVSFEGSEIYKVKSDFFGKKLLGTLLNIFKK